MEKFFYLSVNQPSQVLNDHRKKLNVSISEYFEKLSFELLQLLDIGVIHKRHGSGGIARPANIKLFWLDINKFCFTFDPADCGEYCENTPGDNIRADLDDSVTIRLYLNEMRKVYDPLIEGPDRQFAPLAGTSVLDFGSGRVNENHTLKAAKMWVFFRQVAPHSQNPEFQIDYGTRVYASMEKAAVYKAINNCTKNQVDNNLCQTQCRRNALKNSCKCEPFFYGRNDTVNLCSLEQYLTCLRFNTSQIYTCQESCLPSCETHSYRFHTTGSYSEQSFLTRDELELVLRFPIWCYPIFQEKYAITWANFIGNVGGILDFWMGASLFTFIHLIYYLGKQIVYCFNKETNTGKNVRKMLNANLSDED